MEKSCRKTVLSETGKFLIDLSKLVFGGIILAGIMKFEDVNTILLYSIGGIFVLAGFIIGLILLTKSEKEK